MKKRRKKQSTKKSYTCRILELIMAITVIAILGGVLLKRSIMEMDIWNGRKLEVDIPLPMQQNFLI